MTRMITHVFEAMNFLKQLKMFYGKNKINMNNLGTCSNTNTIFFLNESNLEEDEDDYDHEFSEECDDLSNIGR